LGLAVVLTALDLGWARSSVGTVAGLLAWVLVATLVAAPL